MNGHRDPLAAAAFGAAPGRDVAAAIPCGGSRARWLAAVVLGGQGRYAAAATVLRDMLADPDPLWVSLAASTLASHRRQLGGHAAARRLDALALRRCPPVRAGGGDLDTADPVKSDPDTPDAETADPDAVDAAGARADALIGLAADAIGLGELSTARRLLPAAERAAAGAGWRPAVRLGWARAELALASDMAAAAVTAARAAVRLAELAHAVRHLAKSRLVLAAALAADGERAEADRLLHELVVCTAEHGLVPLRWPAERLLAELHTECDCDPRHREHHRRAAAVKLQLVLRRADVPLRTAAESSLWVPSEGLRAAESAEGSSVGEILSEICTRLCQGSTPRDR